MFIADSKGRKTVVVHTINANVHDNLRTWHSIEDHYKKNAKLYTSFREPLVVDIRLWYWSWSRGEVSLIFDKKSMHKNGWSNFTNSMTRKIWRKYFRAESMCVPNLLNPSSCFVHIKTNEWYNCKEPWNVISKKSSWWCHILLGFLAMKTRWCLITVTSKWDICNWFPRWNLLQSVKYITSARYILPVVPGKHVSCYWNFAINVTDLVSPTYKLCLIMIRKDGLSHFSYCKLQSSISNRGQI